MKLLMKLVGGFFALVFLAVAVFWIGWLRHPSPETVCEHLEEVAKEEGAPQLMARAECVESLQPPEYGMVKYAKRMRCLDGVEKLSEVDGCLGGRSL